MNEGGFHIFMGKKEKEGELVSSSRGMNTFCVILSR